MSTILDKIIERKKLEISELRKNKVTNNSKGGSHRSFIDALKKASSLGIIAEVKKASPSKGIICHNFDPVKIAYSYEAGGAHAISVLTDEHFFQGSIDYLKSVRNTVSLPVLRKDFIIDLLQVQQTAQIGADAMLLIAAALDNSQMHDLYQAAIELHLDPLIEIHSAEELENVMKLDPPLIGINNRNLSTFVTDINLTVNLIRLIPSSVTVVSESGIESGDQARMLKTAGVKALLVGESLMKLDNPQTLIRELRCEESVN
jgi:indole-3-glycerol phosphate synthase